jgi:hypothetical protein
LQSGGTQFYFAPAINDSVSLQVSVNRYISDTSDIVHTVSHHTKIIAENKFCLPNSDNFSAKIDGGVDLIRANGSPVEKYPYGFFGSDLKLSNFQTQLYAKFSITPLSDHIPDYLPALATGDMYYIYGYHFLSGLNFHYQFPIASINAGYSIKLNNERNEKFWHNGLMPYNEPFQVFSTGLSLGEIGIVSMFSNWFFNDETPYIKSYSGLRFHFNKEAQIRHFYVDIAYNYWSKRGYYFGIIDYNFDLHEEKYFGDYPYWNRSIHDVSIKLSAEIETFRIFWKIDNFLNRTNAYIPGYIMPGLIFRWGFSWNILG